MLTKEFSITLDMKRALAFHPFEVVECDTGNVLHILLQNDGEAMDLDGCGVCIVFASSAGFAMQDFDSGVSLGETPGEITVRLYAGSFGAGEVTADVQVYSGEDRATLITSRRFTFRCVTSLISPDILRASATYPPLLAATRAATEAAETALAAAASVDTAVGELNVQADWDETDALSDAFILHKPAIPSSPGEVGAAAAVHAARHASGGADPVTPAVIGAMAADAVPNAHASSHAAGGSDPVTRRFSAVFPAGGWAATDRMESATTVSGGSVEVSAAAFNAAVSGATGTYMFTYDGTNAYWTLNGEQVTLSAYGITLTGTPSNGNTVTVTYSLVAPYTQTAGTSGVAADMVLKADLLLDDVDTVDDMVNQRDAFLFVDRIDSVSGGVKLTCFETEPETGFSLQMEVAV